MSAPKRSTPKPANFDALVDAATHKDRDRWILERDRWKQECAQKGWDW